MQESVKSPDITTVWQTVSKLEFYDDNLSKLKALILKFLGFIGRNLSCFAENTQPVEMTSCKQAVENTVSACAALLLTSINLILSKRGDKALENASTKDKELIQLAEDFIGVLEIVKRLNALLPDNFKLKPCLNKTTLDFRAFEEDAAQLCFDEWVLESVHIYFEPGRYGLKGTLFKAVLVELSACNPAIDLEINRIACEIDPHSTIDAVIFSGAQNAGHIKASVEAFLRARLEHQGLREGIYKLFKKVEERELELQCLQEQASQGEVNKLVKK